MTKPQLRVAKAKGSSGHSIARSVTQHHLDIAILTTTQGFRLAKECVQGKAKPTRHSQMFWGAFCFNRRTSLYPLTGDPESPRGGVTSRRILECLQEQLPTIAEPGLYFAQDNASTHTASIVQSWLRDWVQDNGVTMVDWLPYSPDLNPIENLWKLLKEGIIKDYPGLSTMPKNNSTLQRLCEAAADVWENLKEEVLEIPLLCFGISPWVAYIQR